MFDRSIGAQLCMRSGHRALGRGSISILHIRRESENGYRTFTPSGRSSHALPSWAGKDYASPYAIIYARRRHLIIEHSDIDTPGAVRMARVLDTLFQCRS